MGDLEKEITEQVKSGHQITDTQITRYAKQRVINQIDLNYISSNALPNFNISKL